jgi:hypothetical protein
MNNGIDVIWDNWEKVVGEGTELTLSNTEQAPMKVLLKGNTYQEGTPTPDTPQEVHTVSGDNTVEVSNGDNTQSTTYPINLPVENLVNVADKTNVTSQTTLFTTTLNSGTYTVSSLLDNVGTAGGYLRVLDSSNNVLANANTINSGSIGKSFVSFTLNENKTIKVNAVGVASGYNLNISNIQLDEGSKSNTYTPYGTTPLWLGSIGDYKDTFFKAEEGNPIYDSLDSATKQTLDSNEWYLEKKIGKVVLNGSEAGWNKDSATGENFNYFYRPASAINARYANIYFKIDKLRNIPYLAMSSEEGFYVTSVLSLNIANSRTGIVSSDSKAKQINKFKEWLANNNITVYYVLATPTYTKIEGTLASQLESVYRAKSEEGQTNISQTNDDLPFVLSVSALKELS